MLFLGYSRLRDWHGGSVGKLSTGLLTAFIREFRKFLHQELVIAKSPSPDKRRHIVCSTLEIGSDFVVYLGRLLSVS